MNEKRVVKEWTSKAPSWGHIVEHYQSRPGLAEWLSNRMPVMRGEVEDSPAPEIVIQPEQEAAE